jgi:hypothetical protein
MLAIVDTPGWRTSLIVHGIEVGRIAPMPVVVGLIETAAGGVQLAARIGENGDVVILPLQAATQLIVNLRKMIDERLKITGDRLGGDQT